MLEALRGKVVLVTGSARRVGRALALGFAANGANVVIHHSNSEAEAQRTEADAKAFHVETLIVKGDHRRYADVVDNFAQVKAHFGRIDVLVNSASIFKSADLLDIAPEEWDQVLDINLRAPFWCTQQAGRMMRDAGSAGSIINIADNSGLRPWSTRPHHSVSKAGLIMLTEVTARALAQYNIRANCLALGPVLQSTGQSDASWRAAEDRLPLKRAGDPDDVARAAVFLATNDYITGAVLRVDGDEWLGDATSE